MKKELIINFYNENKNIIGIATEIIIIIGFFLYIGKDKKLFDIFFYSILIITFLYNLIFNINNIEKIIVKNFTQMMIIGIILVILFQPKLGIDNTNTFLMIGGIIAFWYGYKKYERDKEIELIEKYKDIKNRGIDNINDIISSFSEIYFLDFNNYISKNLFYELENILDIEFSRMIDKIKNNDFNNSKEVFSCVLKYSGIYEGKNTHFRNSFNSYMIKKVEDFFKNNNSYEIYSKKFKELQINNNEKDLKNNFLRVILNSLKAFK